MTATSRGRGGGPVLPQQAEWRFSVERDERSASIRVDAPTVTAPELAQLAELLDWLLAAGSADIRVDLGRLSSVDAALLEVLRAAQERLDGELIATALCADAQLTLFVMGLTPSPSHA